MFQFFNRIISFFKRIYWMTSLSGRPLDAIATIIRIHKNQKTIQSIFYRGHIVRFRGLDEQALLEVLVNEEYGFLKKFLSSLRSPTILDVGAHIGTFAIWVLGVNEEAQILSVEADPDTYSVAEINVSEFVKRGMNWRLIRGAAGSKDGALLCLSDTGPSMSHHLDPKGKISVESISLETLISKISSDGSSVDLIKIDIEGAEEAFLCERPDVLKKVETLVIELHPKLCNTERVLSVLKNHFKYVEKIHYRQSTKPLLFCVNDIALLQGNLG